MRPHLRLVPVATREYDMQQSYERGEAVHHRAFGIGQVVAVTQKTATIKFESGPTKSLRQRAAAYIGVGIAESEERYNEKGPRQSVKQEEREIVETAVAALNRTKVVACRINWLGSVWVRGEAVPFGLGTGSADVVGILKGSGRVFCLEFKRPGREHAHKQRFDLQLQWLAEIRRMGGFACVVTSVEEALAALQRARKGETS